MPFFPELADIRFGCGLSPTIAPVRSPQAMLDGVVGTDEMVVRFPIEPFDVFRSRMVENSAIGKKMRKTRGTPEFKAHQKQRKLLNKKARQDSIMWFGRTMLRWTYTEQAFRERLAMFWADHFTALGKNSILRRATSPYIEEAIRPNINGTFADMLVACTTHPLMLHYLDQAQSVGPNSDYAARKPRNSGLNENLAREVMELHTLGVGGPYLQSDVRQLAELFTGMTMQPQVGFKFRKDYAEPGAEIVLNKTYGGDPAKVEPVIEVLRDLAVHPATARHIAWKLAVHFVSDTPDPNLVDHVAAQFQATGGDLVAVYAALLEHPAAWDDPLLNVKPPVDFVASAFRALGVAPVTLENMDEREVVANLISPMLLMGQFWQRPGGPDGWPEEDESWITPQGLSARLRWAMTVPKVLLPDLPDPRKFVVDSLGDRATERVRFAAAAAESKPEAIGLVLSSPSFQRR